MLTVKERILQYIEFKGFTRNSFAEKIFLSNSFFSNQSKVGTDVLLKIFREFPELNFDWVITGRGKMLMANNAKCAECEQWKEKYYKESEEHKEAIKELRALEKKFQSLNLKN